MAVGARKPGGRRPRSSGTGKTAAAPRHGAQRELGFARSAQLLGEWQPGEVRIARGFAECRGLGREQLEDLYQETALALITRPYHDEEHLRNALRKGLKNRALNLHRDERRRGEILSQRAPEIELRAQAGADHATPEQVALARQDRLIVSEFLTELTDVEQRVFMLLAEGMRYRRIGPLLGIAINEARNAMRSCERKRERFQLLYDTGRLCGFRARTIRALQSGEATSEELAERAFAHLAVCPRCQAEHSTSAERLRTAFQRQAAGLLPLPWLGAHLGFATRAALRARVAVHRVLAWAPTGSGSVRERVVALAARGGAGAKAVAAALTVAVIAGGSIGATRLLEHPRARPAHHVLVPSPPAPPLATHGPPVRTRVVPARTTTVLRRPAPSSARRPVHAPGRVVANVARPIDRSALERYEPGGFAYLGVPTSSAPAAVDPPAAHAAAREEGGAFSP